MTAAAPFDLEEAFGDPWDQRNPLGFAEILAADERAELLPDGERLLDAYGLNREFVPAELGGRCADLSRMARELRPVFRRDGALGLGYGVTSLMAAVNVWVSGDLAQRRRLAELMIGGGRVAVGFHELAHGNDLSRLELRAVRTGDRLLLRGRKEVVNNAARAEALVLFARTDPEPGSRGHTQLLVDRSALAGHAVRELDRFGTVGVRGCRLAGIELRDCPVPTDSMIGEPGSGLETALRAFQVTRAVLPSMAIGMLDTQLRVALRFVLGRELYGRTAADLPQPRSLLAGAFADLLVADCLATVVTRELHALPAEVGIHASAVKYLVPRLLMEATDSLAIVLGARFYIRDGEYGTFQKHLRDMPVLSLGHAGPTACLATIVPQLPGLARRAWWRGEPVAPPVAMFRLAEPLPAMRYPELTLRTGPDRLMSALPHNCQAVLDLLGDDAGAGARLVRELVADLSAELPGFAEQCAGLGPRQRTVIAGPASFALAQRYALLLAASACLGVWLHNRDQADPFFRDPGWLAAALFRITVRLRGGSAPLPEDVQRDLFAELIARHDQRRSFDLDNRIWF